MPHDCFGNELKAGDRVYMEFRVKEVFPGQDACNVNLVAIDFKGRSEVYLPTISCNASLTTTVPEAPTPAAEDGPAE